MRLIEITGAYRDSGREWNEHVKHYVEQANRAAVVLARSLSEQIDRLPQSFN